MARFYACAFVPILVAALVAEEAKPAPQLEPTGSVQIQFQKAVWDNGTEDNLDELWGRANFGASFKGDGYSSAVNIRMFPEGFGYEPLTGVSFKEVNDSFAVQVKKTQIAKIQIEQAWVKYSWSMIDVRAGRYSTTNSKTVSLGNFLDQDPGASFQGKLAYHNALDFTLKTGPLASVVLLGVGDQKLNTGYLRVSESAELLDKKLNVGAGYRANVFDKVYDDKAVVNDRWSLLADYLIQKDLKPYVEVGFIKSLQKVDEYGTAILAGTMIPTGGFLNALSLEAEIVPDRQAKDSKKKLVDRPVQVNLYADKKVGKRARFQLGVISDNGGSGFGDMRFALRFSSALK